MKKFHFFIPINNNGLEIIHWSDTLQDFKATIRLKTYEGYVFEDAFCRVLDPETMSAESFYLHSNLMDMDAETLEKRVNGDWN